MPGLVHLAQFVKTHIFFLWHLDILCPEYMELILALVALALHVWSDDQCSGRTNEKEENKYCITKNILIHSNDPSDLFSFSGFRR